VLDVKLSTSIESAKLQFQDKTGAAPKQQRLVFKGKVLADDETVGGVGMTGGDTVHNAPRPGVRGG
jgi:hypothetical protein